MKKALRMTMIMACALAAALLLGACNSGPKVEPSEPGAQMPNPIVEVEGAAEIKTKMGIDMLAPEGAEKAQYSIIADTTAQVTFELDGAEYTYRIAKASGGMEDISGMYIDFAATKEADINGIPCKLSCNDGAEGMINWQDEQAGTVHNISMTEGATEEKLIAVAAEVIPVG